MFLIKTKIHAKLNNVYKKYTSSRIVRTGVFNAFIMYLELFREFIPLILIIERQNGRIHLSLGLKMS